MKRYAIVRVDNNYGPCVLEKEKVPICKTDELCYSGKCPYRYGDTKEQLIKKVLQVMRRNHLGWCNMERISKEIVEFLGVEE